MVVLLSGEAARAAALPPLFLAGFATASFAQIAAYAGN
jgi:hypothetical protein